jgi:CRISPR-associated protein Cas1
VSAGYSPALGFIHIGKMLSFVYDIADLYKTELTIPVAFHVVAAGTESLETRVRYACRDSFRAGRILQRIVPDIDAALGATAAEMASGPIDFDRDEAAPGGLWDLDKGEVAGGINRAGNEDDKEDV